MYVKLSSYSRPTKALEHLGIITLEDQIAYFAKVSNPKGQEDISTSEKLIKYLIKHKHWSPFEMVNIVLEVNTTRDIARQVLRHRSFTFQEFCIAEGTYITTLTKSGNSKKVLVEDLYKRQNSVQYSDLSDNLVRVYDEKTKLLVSAKIKEVFKTGIKDCFKITTEAGKTIITTKEHKFLTTQGFKALMDINIGDFIATNGVKVYQDYEWLKQVKEESIIDCTGVQGIADKANCSYHTIRKWLRKHSLQFTKQDVSRYSTPWNKGLAKELQPMYGKKHSIDTLEKMKVSARSGKDSNLYTNGINGWRKQIAYDCIKKKPQLLLKFSNKCPSCGIAINRGTCDIDHIKSVGSKPELAYTDDNIQILCKPCHKEKTTQETLDSKYTIGWDLVTSIESVGSYVTYDIEVDHISHNYIANSLVTHNSQRYADPSESLGFVHSECRMQDPKNRQSSSWCSEQELIDWWNTVQESVAEESMDFYTQAVKRGIAKEVARKLLPEGLTGSRLYMNGTLRSWIHYCALRSGEETQSEHQILARESIKCISSIFPPMEVVCNGM